MLGKNNVVVCASYLIKRDHCLLAAIWQFNSLQFHSTEEQKEDGAYLSLLYIVSIWQKYNAQPLPGIMHSRTG